MKRGVCGEALVWLSTAVIVRSHRRCVRLRKFVADGQLRMISRSGPTLGARLDQTLLRERKG